MQLESTPIAGLKVVRRQPHADARGTFVRVADAGDVGLAITRSLVQINHSLTRGAGSVRGMHFQFPPFAETKLVTCQRGEILDVAVDLRAGSPTFLHWFGVKLSGEALDSLLIPPGCAHGFQVLSDEAQLLYLHDQPYRPEAEGRVHPLDPAIKIAWPLPVANLSPRDESAPFLAADFAGLAVP